MRRSLSISLFLLLVAGYLNAQANLSEYEQNWHQWRGPKTTGVAPAGDPPIEWSESKNIEWKTEIPGIGHATPIIWKDQIILLAAVKTDQLAEPVAPVEGEDQGQQSARPAEDYIHKFVVLSVNRSNGKIGWQTTVREQRPNSNTHQFGSWASNSPVTDGEHIYAYFGSYGLYCLDMTGRVQWERDLGRMEKVMNFGEGSSPALHGDKLIILRDHQGQSALHVLDKNTGRTIWEIDRDEVSSWATPMVIEYGGRTQIITSATGKVRSYDLNSREVIWECKGMTSNVIPSPVYNEGMLYLTSGYRGNAMLAIDLSKAKGDLTGSDAIIWQYGQNTPYTPSPVLMGDRIYFLKANNGYLSCLDAKDGKEYYTSQRLEGIQNIFTSPLGVKGRIYIEGTEGTCVVVKQGDTFEVLASNTLEDSFYASPVVMGDRLFLKGDRYLYCIAED